MSAKEIHEECKRIQEEYHYFTELIEPEESKIGLYFSVKDNLCVKGVETTAGSAILKGYKPLFDATVVEKLRNAGASLIGKTVCDTFGFGSFNLNTAFEIPLNPVDKSRVTGGSSGGSAGLTAKTSFNHVSIGVSTGGSIACPASYCGVYGFTPTYGRVSRNGLISYADSLDKIGIFAKKTSLIKQVLEIISGSDEKDSKALQKSLNLEQKELRIAAIKGSLDENSKKTLENKGISYDEIELPFTEEFGVPAYYIIATSEASTNLARYSGLRYGVQGDPRGKMYDKYFKEIRSANLLPEEKRRIMLGTFARMAGYRDSYYEKAILAKKKIIQEYKKIFDSYNIILSPTMPSVAPTFEEAKSLTPLQNYQMDKLTVGPNIAGLPHVSIPIENELPIGLLATANHEDESSLVQFMEMLE